MANTADFLGERRMTFSDANILIALYKGLLGREPDAKGMAFHLNKIENGEALDVLVSAFVNSVEFVQGFTSRANMYALDGAPLMEVGLDLTPEQSSRLWENVQQEWSRMGDAEPYHSVLDGPEVGEREYDEPGDRRRLLRDRPRGYEPARQLACARWDAVAENIDLRRIWLRCRPVHDLAGPAVRAGSRDGYL